MPKFPAPISRRDALRFCGSAAIPSFGPLGWAGKALAAPLPQLTLWGPPAGPSITLAHAVAARMLRDVADKVEFKAWRNPDEMRAGLTSGTMQVVIVPTQVAANLFNRGLGVRLVNVMTDGLLYIVANDPALTTMASLRGRKIAVPFRNDTPEFVFRRILKAKGMAAGNDLTVETTGTPIEAIQLLLAGRLDAALVPEPAATAAIVRGKVAGKSIARVMDVQKLWSEITGQDRATLPQAGLAVTTAFRDRHPDLIARIHARLAEATAAVVATPAAAANHAAAALELPWPIIEQSIAWSNLVCRRATEARPALEAMFAVIAEADASILGGKLPGTEFYM
ncbi:MAG: ABC transporter substrate-binding protein [Hyphomicrobiaceae bacterium]|nr:MAG: ABC transporter substrate-binding protein [Hyphomicrobiaceae bacterium]